MTDGDVDKYGVSLNFLTDRAVGNPVIFGICGPGWLDLKANTDTGFEDPITGITSTPTTKSLAVAATQQLLIKDSNNVDRTAVATYVSSDPAKATVSTTGLITGVAAGSATVTATYKGKTATCAVTVTGP